MDEPILVVISLTMFVGSYLAGCIPLFFTLNERRIRIVSIFGAGLLVGTALCVIIPEGVSTLVESSGQPNKNSGISPPIGNLPDKSGFGKPMIKLESPEELHKRHERKEQQIPADEHKKYVEGSVEPSVSIEKGEEAKQAARRRRKREVNSNNDNESDGKMGNGGDPHPKTGGHHSTMNLDGPIGVSLLVGFLFMFVIDQVAKLSHNRSKSLSTLGLVIHAFADGIAMGSASSAGSQLEMQILVFVAIMLHKAPAAFALVSILLAQGLEKARIRRHLLIFSLAAPIGTLLTYAFLHTAGDGAPAGDAAEQAHSRFTGIILLFSAGTFLYIATVHVLPELIESKCGGGGSSSRETMTGSRELLLGGHTSGLAGPISRLSLSEICLFCASALIPAFISSASHGH